MSIKKISIEGLRGFREKTNINFAIPDKQNPGSGLTVLVGANNSGKSTIIEAIHLLNNHVDTIPSTLRNLNTENGVMIEVEDTNNNIYTLKSTSTKGAFVEKKYNGVIEQGQYNRLNVMVLSNKRNVVSTFSNNFHIDRENYRGNINGGDYRSENNLNSSFGGRLITIDKNRKQFNNCLQKVLSPLPDWTIESSNENSLYLEFSFDGIKHGSKGAGDGYINIFNIVDALYDSEENNVILIDEPEVSLHPDLQKKLFALLVEYSKDKQIIISTHSPYFVDWKLFSNNAKIIRLKKEKNTIKTFELTNESREGIKKILKDNFQPHTLSFDTNEFFFLNDNIILTEGQDDVLCYKKIFKKYNYEPNASFFGWGAGGVPKMRFILNILKDLGYEKVFTIVDNNRKKDIIELGMTYKKYRFYAIEADDVRDKKIDEKIEKLIEEINKLDIEEKIKEEVLSCINSKFTSITGIVNNMSDEYIINNQYEKDIINLIEKMKQYFQEDTINTDKEKDKTTNNSRNNDVLARHLLEKWLKGRKIYEYAKNKYKKFDFNSGGGGDLSFKRINDNKYYVIMEQEDCISNDYAIKILYHVIINIKTKKVKLKHRKIISNTLPISWFEKKLLTRFF